MEKLLSAAEAKEWAEQITEQLTKFHEQITRDYILSIQN